MSKPVALKFSFFPFRIPRRKPENSFLLRVCVFVVVVISLLALLREEGWPAASLWILSCTVVGFWSSWMRRERWSWMVRGILAIAMIVAGAQGLLSIMSSPYDPRVPLANLLMWLQVIHSFDMPSRLDLSYSLLVSVILMALAAVFSTDLVFGVFLCFYLFCALFCLLFISYREAEDQSLNALTQPPRAIFGFLFRAGIPFALAAFSLGFVLFLFVPRLHGFRFRMTPIAIRIPQLPIFQGTVANPGYPVSGSGNPLFTLKGAFRTFNPGSYFGFNPIMDLRVRGQLSGEVVMKVKSQEPGYWRGLAFDDYDGTSWSISSKDTTSLTLDGNYVSLDSKNDYPSSKEVVQSYYIEHQLPNLVFLVYKPVAIYFPSGNLYLDSYDSFRVPFYLEPGTVYTVVSHVPVGIAASLKQAGIDYPPEILARYLQLPDELPLRVKELAKVIVQGKTIPYGKATAIVDWLHQFPYSLDIPPPPAGRDAVDHFLFDLKKGYCEQYASAFAVLARSVGIPVRVVTGYATGTFNPFTLDYEVRESDAHAWDEVYFSNVGWIPFDASPPYDAQPDLANSSSINVFSAFLPYALSWMRNLLPAGFLAMLRRLFFVFVLCAVGWLILAVWRHVDVFKGLLRKQEARKSASMDPVRKRLLSLYRRLEKRLAHKGHIRLPSETPLEYVSKLSLSEGKQEAEAVVDYYLKARFSAERLPEELTQDAEVTFSRFLMKFSGKLNG